MTQELHTLTGAYAAHAMSVQETEDFEQHLQGCPSCEQEIRELLATAAQIGAAEFLAPPPELKARVMADITRTRQLPPTVRPAAAVVDLDSRRRNRLTLMVAASVAAVAIVAGGIVGGVAYQATQHTHRVQAAADRIAAVLSAPDARTITARGPDGSSGTAVVSASRHAAVFTGASWPKAGADHVFQLWVIDASGARSAGLLTWHSNGTVAPVVATDLPAGAGSLGVTLEPAGGSKQPTTTPVLLMPLTA